MASSAKNSIFNPAAPARDKADQTTRVVRTIIEAEAAAREAKTAKLRDLRLQREAVDGPAPSARPAKKKLPTARR